MKIFTRPAIALVNPQDQKLRTARAAAARKCSTWTEIDAPVQRGSFFIDTDDRIPVRYAGQVWETGSAHIVSSTQPLLFWVDARDTVEVFERSVIWPSWTDYQERKARLNARRRPAL